MANLARLMASVLPKDAKISKDTKVLMQELVSEFICFITAEANDSSIAENRKAIALDDHVSAFETLGQLTRAPKNSGADASSQPPSQPEVPVLVRMDADLDCFLPVLCAATKVLPNMKAARPDLTDAPTTLQHQMNGFERRTCASSSWPIPSSLGGSSCSSLSTSSSSYDSDARTVDNESLTDSNISYSTSNYSSNCASARETRAPSPVQSWTPSFAALQQAGSAVQNARAVMATAVQTVPAVPAVPVGEALGSRGTKRGYGIPAQSTATPIQAPRVLEALDTPVCDHATKRPPQTASIPVLAAADVITTFKRRQGEVWHPPCV
jgi:histone H3/H4